MGKRYTASVQLHCWKQHTCASCGCLYSYVLDRKVSGTASTEAGAQAALQKEYARAQREESDMHPCPNCGQYQPDMIGIRLARKRKTLAWIAVIMPILVPILCASYAVQSTTLTWVAFFYCAAFLLLEFFLGFTNPNSNREANRDLAANRIASGTLNTQQMATAPDPNSPALPVPTRSIGHLIAMALLAGCIVLSFCPEILRSASRWPLNADCYPPVIGPGDSTRVYMNDTITSIKSYWRGRPSVNCAPAGGGDLIPVGATTHQNDWGNEIRAKSSEKSNSSRPWVQLQFPDDATLAGKKLNCTITLDVEYPQMQGGSNFVTREDQLRNSIQIDMAPLGAGGSYNSTWWAGTVFSLLGVFVAAVTLVYVAHGFQRKAKPTQVMPLQKTQADT